MVAGRFALLFLCACSGAKPSPEPANGDSAAPVEDSTSIGDSAPTEIESTPVVLSPDAQISLGVQVLDESGEPLPGASVSLAGRSARVDAQGNARISGIVSWTEAAVLRISAPGHADLLRRLDSLEEGDVRLRAALPTLGDLGWYDASLAVEIDVDPFEISLPAYAFADAGGERYEGWFHLSATAWPGHDDDADPDPTFTTGAPAPLLTEGLDALESRGMVQVEVTDSDGAPLFLDDGQRTTLRVEVTGDADLPTVCEEGAEWWWVLDEGQGLWTPAFDEPVCGEDIDLVDEDGVRTLVANVEHFTKYNVDLRRTRGCAVLSADLDDKLLRGAEVELEGPGYSSRVSAADGEDVVLLAIPRAKATARLYLYDGLVDEQILPPGVWDSEAETCSGGALVLSASADLAAGAATGPGLLARLRVGDCPATGGTVVVEDSAGTEVARYAATGPTAWIDGLEAGSWTVSLRDASDGVIDRVTVDIAAGQVSPSLLSLAAPADSAFSPPGGCLPLPCEGEQCSTCLSLSVTEDGLPAAEIPVSWAGGSEALATGSDGEVCVDLTEADARITAALPDGTQGSGTLPRGASCAADSCLNLALRAGTGLSCPTGTRAWTAQSVWLGPTDPGFFDADLLVAPSPVAGGALALTILTEGDFWTDASLLQNAFGCDEEGANCAFSGEVWSYEALVSDSNGDISSAGLRLRAGRRDGPEGVSMDLGLGLDRLARSEPVDASAEGLVLKGWEDGYNLPFRADSGTITYLGQESGAVVLQMDEVVLTCTDDELCSDAEMTLTGRWVAPLLSVASFPSGLSWLEQRPLYGGWAQVASAVDAPAYGPAAAADEAAPLELCLPNSGPWMFAGAAEPGALRPFSALQVWRKGAPALAGNTTDGGRLLAQSDAVWVDRQVVAAELLRQGEDLGKMDEQAAILGLAMRCEGVSCEVVTEGEVLLESPVTACADQRVDLAAEGRDGAFVFVGVDPVCATVDRPYVLRLREPGGAEILSFRQRVVPVAGGAMVVLPEGLTRVYTDADGDGYGAPLSASWGVVEPGKVRVGGDCDDDDAEVHPNAEEEIGDSLDSDCDGEEICFVDEDDDGFADPAGTTALNDNENCKAPTDCDDSNAEINPDADELCDGVDNNCDDLTDEDSAIDAATWYADSDGDGFGDVDAPTLACDAPVATTADATDCDDADASVYPGAAELCEDGLVQDCDGTEAVAFAACTWGEGLEMSITDAEAKVKLTSETEGNSATDIRSLSATGDMNGDGFDDLLMGVGDASADVYVVLGQESPDEESSIDDAALWLLGEEGGDHAGISVAWVGDVDLDAYDDMLIGASGSDAGARSSGAAYLVLGSEAAAGELSLSDADLRLVGEAYNDDAGQYVSGAGDVDDDGLVDLLIGAPWSDAGGSAAGATYVVLKPDPTGGDLSLSEADMRLVGDLPGYGAALAVSGLGDINGDGFGDLIVGSFANLAYVVLGSNPVLDELSLADADGRLYGESPGDYAGNVVSGVGDVNGDGLNDLIVGAQAWSAVASYSGAVYVLFGSDAFSGDLSLSASDARLAGEDADDYAPTSLSGAGDVDGDSFADLLIGVSNAEETEGVDQGAAYLVKGEASFGGTRSLADAEVRVAPIGREYDIGSVVAGGGDIDGNGLDDLLVGVTELREDDSHYSSLLLFLPPGY